METLRPESFEILASEDSADSRILTVALRTVNVAATETHSGALPQGARLPTELDLMPPQEVTEPSVMVNAPIMAIITTARSKPFVRVICVPPFPN